MSARKLIGFLLLFAVFVAGVWLVVDSAELRVESPARIQAIQALGPAGSASVVNADGAEVEMSVIQGTVERAGVITAEDLLNASPPTPNKYYEQYMQGEIEVENFIDGPFGEAYALQLQQESLSRPVDEDVQVYDGNGLYSSAISIGTNIRALDYETTSGLTPPDMEIAVGNNHVVEVVNSTLAFYRKNTGALIYGPADMAPLLAARGCPAASNFYFDPVAVYDDESERYVVSIMVATGGTDYLCVAVSQTSNPAGAWNVYPFDCSFGSLLCDNHEIAAGYDAIYFAADMFGVGFPRIFAMDKAAMYAGDPASYTTLDLSSFYFNLRPVKMYGYAFGGWPADATESHYYVATPYGGGGSVQVWQFDDPFGASPTMNFRGSLSTTTHGFPVSQPQLGGSNVTANDDRLVSATYWNGAIWAAHQVGCNPGAGTVTCLKWYEVDVSGASPALAQSGTFSSDGEYRSYPDLAVNSCGQTAIGYTKFSASSYPSVYVAGRAPSTPAGTLIGEAPLHVGTTPHSCYDSVPYRWGDYSDLAIDPTDGKTFWYAGQYAEPQASCTWATRLTSFVSNSCQ